MPIAGQHPAIASATHLDVRSSAHLQFLSNTGMPTCGVAPNMVHTVGIDDFAPPGATDPEQSLPQDWRDVRFRRLGQHLRFVADVLEIAFAEGWVGSTRPADMRLEPTQTSGAGHAKGFNDIACSTTLLPEWQDGTRGRKRIHVVIEVQWTVQASMPFRVMQYEAMRYQQLQRGQEPAPRIQTIVLYIGDDQWNVRTDAGEAIADVLVETRPRVPYTLVELQRLEFEPGSKNLLVLLSGVMRGETLKSLTVAAEALADLADELDDLGLEQDLFKFVQAQGKVKWPELDWSGCKSLAGLVRLLKEDEMTWPEKWMTQMRPNWREEVWEELRTEVLPEVRTELRTEVRKALADELRPEVRTQLVAELRPEVVAKLEAEVKAELRTEMKAALRAEAEGKGRA